MKKVFIIAEAGVNHNGDVGLARKLIDAAFETGADAVKFQTFRAESLVTAEASTPDYQVKNLNLASPKASNQYEILKKLELSHDDFISLKKYSDEKGILFLSTPFDREAADFLEKLVDRFKVSSGDCTNLPFLEYVAKKGKPMIISTGMTMMDEVAEAVRTVRPYNIPLSLLHCTTNYPCPPDEVNLKAMATLSREFGLPVGYSDHTAGIEVSVAAVALAATIIEKHLTLDKNLPGPDHQASLEPDEFKKMVTAIRNVEASLGDGVKAPKPSEIKIREQARRSIVFAKNLKAGSVLAESDLNLKRPGDGLPPSFWKEAVGKTLTVDVTKDALLKKEMVR